MKRLTVCAFYFLIGIFVLGPQHSYAQSDSSSKAAQLNQEQTMKELLSEVRQLRADLRQMSVNSYRAQMVIERLRLQQGQVNLLTLELSKVRTQIGDLRSGRAGLKERLVALEKKYEVGMIPEPEVVAAKAAIEELNQREQGLMEREPQLTAELNLELGNIEELNKRLDEIERELLTIGKSEASKPGKKDR